MDLVEAKVGTDVCRHPWELARFGFFSRVIAKNLNLKAPVRVLDVGSGDSWFSTELLNHLPKGSKISCWDAHFSDEVMARLQTTYAGREVSFSRELPAEKYDLILMMDVLEHIEDDLGALKKIVSENLRPQGHLLMSVPAWQKLFSTHDTYLKHYRRYSPAQGLAVVKQAGLIPVKSGGLFHSLLYPRILEKLFESLGLKGTAKGAGQWQGGKFLTGVIAGVLGLDSWLLNGFFKLPGLSWWVLCRKP